MMSSLRVYNKNLNNENIQIFGLLLVYLFIWLISNNSFAYHRDEMWYTMYSVYFTDKTTNDIRHITQNDIHQIAFLPAFRYVQGFFINMFGQNIFSLRSINIFFALVTLFFTLKTMKRYKFSFFYLLLFILLISFDSQIITYSHKARPDFSVSMLSLTSIILILDFLRSKQIKKLFISSIFAVLAGSFYWNGLATITAYGAIMLCFFYFREISLKNFLLLSIFSLLLMILLLGLPIYKNFELFKETFTNKAILENAGSTNLINIILVFKKIIMSGKYGILICLVFFIIIYLIFLNLFNKKLNSKSNFYLLTFMIIIFIILSIRSSGIRHIYMFLPLIYLTMFFWLNNINQDLKIHKFFFEALVCIILTLNTFHSLNKINKDYGQIEAYGNYTNEIASTIDFNDSLIMMRYNMAWTVDNPKFYIANFIFKEFKNQSEFNELMKNYDLKYVIIDETTRKRMNDQKTGTVWNNFFKRYLEDNFELKKIFYNKFYIKNKLYQHQYQEGYKNEIWIRR